MGKLIQGIGYNDGKYQNKVDGKIIKSYKTWVGMLNRCYSEYSFLHHPAYLKCTVSPNFKSYSFFHEWCQKQVGFNRTYTQLDKDILFKGNTVYSEETCVFVPRAVNLLMVLHEDVKRGLPLGVVYANSKYTARLKLKDGIKHLGTFSTAEEAFQAYKSAKEAYIKLQAERYKNLVDLRVYEALMSYQVESTLAHSPLV